MKKTYIWRGLCTLLVLVFSLTMFGQSLAFTREGDVNLFLGTLPLPSKSPATPTTTPPAMPPWTRCAPP